MGNYENLKAAIADVITTNGNNEITGAVLRQVLQTMVSSIGGNATFGGVVTPETNVGTPDQNVFYVAKTPGVYQYMGGATVGIGEIGFFTNTNNRWSVQTIVLDESFASLVNGSTFNVLAQGDRVEVSFNTADGEPGTFVIPSATIEKAGVMSVGDKKIISSHTLTCGNHAISNPDGYAVGAFSCGYIALNSSAIRKIKTNTNGPVILYFVKSENNVIKDIITYKVQDEPINGEIDVDIVIPLGYEVFIFGCSYSNSPTAITNYIPREDLFVTESIVGYNGYADFEVTVEVEGVQRTIGDIDDYIRYVDGQLNYRIVGLSEHRSRASDKWTALYGSEFPYDSIVTHINYGIADDALNLALVSKDTEGIITDVEYITIPVDNAVGEIDVSIKAKKGQLLFVKNVMWDNADNFYHVWYDDLTIGNAINTFRLYPHFQYKCVAYSDMIDKMLQTQPRIDNIERVADNALAIAEFAKSRIDKYELKEVFFDDFSTTNNAWGGTWRIDNVAKTMTPTSIGDITTHVEWLRLGYNADKRLARFRVILNNDTVFSTGAKRGLTNNGEGESYITIDCANKKIIAYRRQDDYTGIDLSQIAAEEPIFEIVNGREYIVELEKNDFTFYIRIYDTVTADVRELKIVGWDAGRLNWYYFLVWNDGTAPIIKDFRISILSEPIVMFVGDSITEGVGMYSTDSMAGANSLYYRYAEIIRNDVGKCIISAMGGATIDDVLSKFESEFDIIKPKFISLCIGTNGGIEVNTEDKFKTFIDNCVNVGITPIINLIPCNYSGSYIAVNEMIKNLKMSQEYGDKFILGCAFDVATARDNYPLVDEEHPTTMANYTTRINGSLFVDLVHPNYLGSVAMAKRFRVDVPIIFNI